MSALLMMNKYSAEIIWEWKWLKSCKRVEEGKCQKSRKTHEDMDCFMVDVFASFKNTGVKQDWVGWL